MGRNDAIIFVDIAPDTPAPERCPENAIEHVALDEQIAICQPRGQFLHEPAALVRHRQGVATHDFLEERGIPRVGAADFLERAKLAAFLAMAVAAVAFSPSFVGPCALEDDDFPFEAISDVGEIESWRKEINRPVYHIHKWWTQRLGTVFRAITLGTLSPAGTDILSAFYRPVRVKDLTVFDPFMGSGTTIGEAAKLGARAIGRDINPVAHFLVRNALAFHDREAVLQTFRGIERDVADQIRTNYKTVLPDGSEADVLYYFWVKQVDCPECASEVDLFSSRAFAKHA